MQIFIVMSNFVPHWYLVEWVCLMRILEGRSERERGFVIQFKLFTLKKRFFQLIQFEKGSVSVSLCHLLSSPLSDTLLPSIWRKLDS